MTMMCPKTPETYFNENFKDKSKKEQEIEIKKLEKEIEELEKNEEIRNMPCFPAKDSVKLIDGIIVVKLS